ncbi:hypothetical protein [Echinimonas agarilytica]|uniref:Uncharacterized protein n=1 Tax=Echinimonas agarilytica TaxID=1215918 RepID=A0AA42B8D3_9GAMM|nr:hypothetical protein [Echinimonas agarilytica]MCM2681085.1 hypothetical protein [Echinimonas agarilytica]
MDKGLVCHRDKEMITFYILVAFVIIQFLCLFKMDFPTGDEMLIFLVSLVAAAFSLFMLKKQWYSQPLMHVWANWGAGGLGMMLGTILSTEIATDVMAHSQHMHHHQHHHSMSYSTMLLSLLPMLALCLPACIYVCRTEAAQRRSRDMVCIHFLSSVAMVAGMFIAMACVTDWLPGASMFQHHQFMVLGMVVMGTGSYVFINKVWKREQAV